ncbi:hypothetical protein K503DRAFT_853745 [Rhizopogon vinicolor AM-OR11-026]|uniref:Class II aldolase/adducin N-terminal domain-containing protein n=1 Tax=Rhizopogon vinicolor AM-OR11-026 TaxID=1314800 RepID=A0A1B7ND29_9AGAM|nr:hypothetical protein K503DRAFT_853745 [Rhizopogon vinicolor AM-OR11-026]
MSTVLDAARNAYLTVKRRQRSSTKQTMRGHNGVVAGVAFFKDGRRAVTGSHDSTLRIWNIQTGALVAGPLKGHTDRVRSVAVSPDDKLIASGGDDDTIILWDVESKQKIYDRLEKHGDWVRSVCFSPNGKTLASGSDDKTVVIWDVETGNVIATLEGHRNLVLSVAFSPDGLKLASGSWDKTIRVWRTDNAEHLLKINAHQNYVTSVVWSPDGHQLVSVSFDKTIKFWDSSTGQQVGQPYTDHTESIFSVAISVDGCFIATASYDKTIRLWSTRMEDISLDINSKLSGDHSGANDGSSDNRKPSGSRDKQSLFDILNVTTVVVGACIARDFHTAEELLTEEIDTNTNNYESYANRSVVRARNGEWDSALQDAVQSITIQPSLIRYISKGIVLCGKEQLWDAMEAFDLGFVFSNRDPMAINILLLIKAIVLFNANHRYEAMRRVENLAAACQGIDTLPCTVVDLYLRVQHAIIAFDNGRYSDSADQLTARIENVTDLMLQRTLSEPRLKIFTVRDCTVSCVVKGNEADAASDHEGAIELYSAAIALDASCDSLFAHRGKANLGRHLYLEALADAEQVVELDPSSYVGYELKHAALLGAQRYDEAIETFKNMLIKLDADPDMQIRDLRRQYVSPSQVDNAILTAIRVHLENAPHRLINTSTGRLCDREAQVNAFKASTDYKKLLASTSKQADLSTKLILDVVGIYFRCVMLSHRWEGKELLLRDVLDKVVYDLHPVGNMTKLQSFCKTARDAGYRWTWVDTCCIDQSNNVEVQESVNSMFTWYRLSALMIVYLSDVPPSSQPGALAESVWNTRGWTCFQRSSLPQFEVMSNIPTTKLRDSSKDIPYPPTFSDAPIPPTFSDAFEYRAFLKFRLAQAYRIFAKYGFDGGVAGHITVQDPIKPDCFWVSPWGVHFKLIQPELLLLINQEGKIQDEESGPIRVPNKAAYLIHSAIHEARPEIICVAHSHTTYGKAFGTLGVPLDPITQDSCVFYEDHAFCDFRGIVDDHEEGQAIAAALGSKKAAILQNHGLLVATKSIESVVFFFISLEKCCQVQIIADQAAAVRGQRPRTIDREAAIRAQEVFGSEYAGWFSGIIEFQLLEHEEGKKFEYIPAGSANTKEKL